MSMGSFGDGVTVHPSYAITFICWLAEDSASSLEKSDLTLNLLNRWKHPEVVICR